MKKSNFMPSIVLGAICLVVALLLSLVNSITAPVIEAAQNAAANESLVVVLPGGSNFEEIALDTSYPAAITKGYKADGGYVFQANVTGKSSGLIVLCGIDSDGKIVGTKVISDQETDDYDKNVFPFVEGTDGKYKGMDLNSFAPYLVSGATLTSKAYGEAIKAALQAYVIANGGSVDVRGPEQILQDSCNEALGTSGVKFSRWFATEVLDGIDAVYEAEDKSGRVFVIGEVFVGVKADGTIVNIGTADEAVIKSANDAISAITETEISELPAGNRVVKFTRISVTNNGNYIFEIETKGYQALFDYGDGTVINIKISISADGKIIDCLTLSHNESKGFGDACATEEYFEQFRGASNSDIVISAADPDGHADQISPDCTDIGAIASATFTTSGYQKAVKAAFEAFELFTANGGEE